MIRANGGTLREPDTSIIVVHWNVPEFLSSCLDSITAEVQRTAACAEILVVDNASESTHHREIVSSYGGKVRLVELSENRGYAAGCNAGIRETTGDRVLLLNPDTELLPGALDMLLRTIDVSAHVGMVSPLLLNPDGSLQSAGYRFPGVANTLFDLWPLHPRLYGSRLNGRIPSGDGELPVAVDYTLGAAMMLKRSAVESVRLLDESYGMYSEEIDLARRLEVGGWTRLLAPAARVVHYGGRSTSQQPQAMREALWLSRARYHRRWTSRPRRLMISGLIEIGTRLQDWREGPGVRASNQRIRSAFRRAAFR